MTRDPVTPCRSDLFKALPPIKWEFWQHMTSRDHPPSRLQQMDYALIALPVPWVLLLQALEFSPPPQTCCLLFRYYVDHSPLDMTNVKVHPKTSCVIAAARTKPVWPMKSLCCPLPPAATSLVSPNPLSKHSSGATYIISQADLVSKAPIPGAHLSRQPVHF